MASREKLQNRIIEWCATNAIKRRAERSIEPIRGYDTKYARHDIEHERVVNEARAAASLAKDFLSKGTKPPE